MTKEARQVGSVEISMERIIENIRSIRDENVSELIKDEPLQQFLSDYYNILALSAVRMEFLKRDLRVLRDTNLDLVHYATLIKLLKETNQVVPDKNHPLFLLELKGIFEKVRG